MLTHVHRTAIVAIAAWAVGLGCIVAELRAAADAQSPPNAEEVTLARVPAKSPAESLSCCEVAEGFRVELVAVEPLVVDPVAMAFDEAGRLYVVEMRDYSEQDKERLGRVRMLTDSDGDGQFDTSHVFLEGLSWPTAVACYDGGIFVGAAPDILYCKDTDGDDRADVQHVVFSGFGRGNVQGLLNSFQWGLDHRIYGATSSTGGEITRPGATSAPLALRGRDFAFDPRTLDLRVITGGGQHGMSFDRWGDRFVCSNSDHLQAIVFEERYLARNPLQSVASARRSIAVDGPQAAVFRSSPVEAWRIARTNMRLAGIAPGPIEGGGRPAGYFTSATGVTIYEGDLWGDAYRGWALVADVGSNLIHRKRLVPDGVTYVGVRVDADREFVRSSDIWFRPVQMALGPEGAVYVADMYREVIEHPESLPVELKRQLDLTSGNDRGRIYRIVPADYRYTRPPSLAAASTRELVEALDHPNAWRRQTADRLLYERRDRSAVPLLRARLSASNRPEGRIAVLYALEGLGALSTADVLRGLNDPHPQVRRHALRLSEPLLPSSANLRRAVLSLVDDVDPMVQFQLGLTLGEIADPQVAPALAKILIRNSAQRDITGAVLTSVHDCAGPVLESLLADRAWLQLSGARPILAAIVGQILRQGREDHLAVVVAALDPAQVETRLEATTVMLQVLSRVPADAVPSKDSPQYGALEELRRENTKALVGHARSVLEESSVEVDQRVAAVQSLGLDAFENQYAEFDRLLSPREPAAVHRAVLEACGDYSAAEVAPMVLSHWAEFPPDERRQATELLLRREAWTLALLRHLAAAGESLATLEPGQVAMLENYPFEEVRRLVGEMRGSAAAGDRQQVFQQYRKVVSLAGDAEQGKLLFQKHCSSCHELDVAGHSVGPQLAAMTSRGVESLLFNVLVPNAEVDPRFLTYSLLTVDGEVFTGVIAGETSASVTLRGADGKSTTVLRVDIDELHGTGKSLMPEGFEALIDKSGMADLLAYLQQTASAGGRPQ